MQQQRGHLTTMTCRRRTVSAVDCSIAVESSSEAAQAAADIVFLASLNTNMLAIKTARSVLLHRALLSSASFLLIATSLATIDHSLSHLETFLVTSMIMMSETIHVDLVVFLALFADLATYELRPTEWQLLKIWTISVILGNLLAIATWIVRGSMFQPHGGLVENSGSIQDALFLEVSLTQNWLIVRRSR
ncbi:hypothetical protein D0867_02313 [Hortaea werneckii]|uniref:Uncharacterized protein n=1 Tax=Hortaea werneckii TaxID=91943 RepID=A0A3M7A625_HORWE|nr:hypothetical protein D0867_02313 [Hortaea werneckii]RMY38827.1 hypothetical protein D0866_02336 [Hortaea werneckii]